MIEGPDRSEALDIPPSLEQAAARSRLPTDWLLRRLAEGVVSRERRYQRELTHVRLTVWRTEFDRATLGAAERPLRTFVYDVHRAHGHRSRFKSASTPTAARNPATTSGRENGPEPGCSCFISLRY